MARRASLLALAVLIAGFGCGPEDLQLPPAPDMSALVAAYETPAGTIDPQRLDQVLSDGRARLAALHLSWLPDLLAQALTRLRARLENNGVPDDPVTPADRDRPRIDAVITVTQICRGWDDPAGPPNAALNGTLTLPAVIEANRLRRTLAATATACHARLSPANGVVVNALIDATLDMYFYDRLPVTVKQTKVLVQLSGRIGTAAGSVSGSFDFRIDYPDVDVRLARPGGDVILSVGLDGVTVRAANATYRCDAALLACGPV